MHPWRVRKIGGVEGWRSERSERILGEVATIHHVRLLVCDTHMNVSTHQQR